jgi:hypothetical protein
MPVFRFSVECRPVRPYLDRVIVPIISRRLATYNRVIVASVERHPHYFDFFLPGVVFFSGSTAFAGADGSGVAS